MPAVFLLQIASLKKQVAQKELSLLDKDKQVGPFFRGKRLYFIAPHMWGVW